jgi:Rod binding domain-containing protein
MAAVSRLAINSAGQSKSAATTEQAAKDFESVLLNKLLQEMQQTIPKSGLLDDNASDQVQDIFWFYMAQDLSSKGGLGLWKQVYKEFQPASAKTGAASPTAEHKP